MKTCQDAACNADDAGQPKMMGNMMQGGGMQMMVKIA